MSKIIESNSFSEILNHVDEKTLVLFDIDGTLIEPTSLLGGPAWFAHVFAMLSKKGLEEEVVVEKTYAAWVRLQKTISVRTIEKNTADVVKKIHEKNVQTMALTGRAFGDSEMTFNQLKSVNISFEKNTIHNEVLDFGNRNGFYRGILSAGLTGDKGENLIEFFEKINFFPEKMVFVDDLPFYIEEVKKIADAKNIEFTGIRYGAADDRYVTFDPARAIEDIKIIFKDSDHQDLIDVLG